MPKRKFTLPKSHILSGKKNFEHLFSNSALITAASVNLRYTIYSDPAKKTLVGFIAPKKLGKAVKRVQLRRFLREAYRTNQYLIRDTTEQLGIGLHFVLMAKRAETNSEQIRNDVIKLLQELRHHLLSNTSF